MDLNQVHPTTGNLVVVAGQDPLPPPYGHHHPSCGQIFAYQTFGFQTMITKYTCRVQVNNVSKHE